MINASQTTTGTITFEGFGQTIASTGSSASPYLWKGDWGYRANGDPGLVEVGARFYDPQVGRFISRDKVLANNPYTYCDHNPINRADPSGADWLDVAGVVGFVIGAVALPLEAPALGVIALALGLPDALREARDHIGVPLAKQLFPIVDPRYEWQNEMPSAVYLFKKFGRHRGRKWRDLENVSDLVKVYSDPYVTRGIIDSHNRYSR